MNRHLSRHKLLLLILLSFGFFTGHGQDLLKSRQSAYYTYIYKITDAEALKVYRRDTRKVDAGFLHTLVDSFPAYKKYEGNLDHGHYLKVHPEKNRLRVSITTVHKFDVKILDNDADLCVQVFDLKGRIIDDAKVRVRWKMLRYNKAARSYIDRKSNQKGILKITHEGFTAYYDLNRQYNNSTFKRIYRKIAFGTPVKYVWIPVDFIINLPIDGVKSVIEGWPVGTIAKTRNFFVNSFRRMACLFDDYYCPYNRGYRFSRKFTGYMVMNKPKFRPGDTVKMKAFITKAKGRPLSRSMDLILTKSSSKEIKLATVHPYRAGGYSHEFVLDDSLELQLDQNYYLSFRKSKHKTYIKNTFRYEDYELAGNKMEIRVDEAIHFRGQDYLFYVRGTDENDLNLPDARLEILITPASIQKHFKAYAYVPDTLLYLTRKLDPTGETEITVTDSLFPEMNLEYTMNIRMLTSDNEVLSENRTVSYFYEKKDFNIRLDGDSIRFVFEVNGEPAVREITVRALDNFKNETLVYRGLSPCALKLNPYFGAYRIEADSLSDIFLISTEPSLLQCYSERTNDSIHIRIENPRQIPFSYSLYRRNQRILTDYADSLSLVQKSKSKQNYYLSLHYLWGGKMVSENYRIPLIDKKLNISVVQPRLIYPGQKTTIEVQVRDTDGDPVEGVDITAYSVTRKFDHVAPYVPGLSRHRKARSAINSFYFGSEEYNDHQGKLLDYEAWKVLAGLDSIEYYKFIYPGSSIYRFEYPAADSITQFAPFVTWRGEIEPVQVIYVDNKPVFFGWSTNKQSYSFRIDSGYHQIRLRTMFKQFTIDSLYFSYGKKLIFSLDADAVLPGVRTDEAKMLLSDHEKRSLYKYILPYRDNFGEHLAYIEQNGDLQLLNSNMRYFSRSQFAGPVSGNLRFQLLDSFTTDFRHEPFMEYEFTPGFLKMRSIDEDRFPFYLTGYQTPSFSDAVLTPDDLKRQWQEHLNDKRRKQARYFFPTSTSPGAGRMQLLINAREKAKDIPLNLLMFRYDDHEFLRVYPGNTNQMHELEEGWYKVLFFYSGARYQIEDSLYVKPDGLNFYALELPETYARDSFSIQVSKLIEEALFKPRPGHGEEARELNQIYYNYQQQFRYTGVGDIVEGYVTDAQTGEVLPGVTVLVKGTTFGTVTDINGYYSIKVPEGNPALVFSFVGYLSSEVSVRFNDVVNVVLDQDILALDEVVVIGYGTSSKYSLTGAAHAMETEGIPADAVVLQGRAAGVSITPGDGQPGEAVSIRIRGMDSYSFKNEPLYIINGNVFTGDIGVLDPSVIQNIRILQDSAETSVYGARGAHGVVIIETGEGQFQPAENRSDQGADFDQAFFEAASQASSIRDNFSDYAFWQPELTTDKEGKARFEVIFPDDITSWDTYYLAMNRKRQTGQEQSLIKSYKPVMAQLAVPRFLIRGDSVHTIGKVKNYTGDSIRIDIRFEIDDNEAFRDVQYCVNVHIDTLPVLASEDSLTLVYSVALEDGYFDGERREIPVYPPGLEEIYGYFHVFDKDTAIHMEFDTSLGTVQFYARADVLDVLEEELSRVIHYRYGCNEQIASKLKALLNEHQIALFRGKAFHGDQKVRKLIRLLLRNQKDKGLWGWWQYSDEREWISLHVLEALIHAEQLGYSVKLDRERIVERLVWELENSDDFNSRVYLLRMMYLLQGQVNYQAYIRELEQEKNISLQGRLQLTRLRQMARLEYDLNTLQAFQDTSYFGNVYITDTSGIPNLLSNDIQNTILAYRILRADTSDHAETLLKMRNYFFEKRRRGCWENTFESVRIIETILPDMLKDKPAPEMPVLHISGSVEKTVTEFPFEMIFAPEDKIEISTQGDFPVYVSSTQRSWNPSPEVREDGFRISTEFSSGDSSGLVAGKEVKLYAELTVDQNAEFVMITLPIPAGCSYADKRSNYRNETHREYFKNEVAIFCEFLPKGTYRFEVDLIPRYTGSFTLNPAQAGLMYFPTINGNTGMRRIIIE